MVAQLNGNINAVDDTDNHQAAIQINRKICSLGVSKEQLKPITQKFNSIQNWKTETISVEKLAEYLKKGYSVRAGIKDDGNDKGNVSSISWLFLDFDSSTLEATQQSALYSFAALYYYTPSYQPGVNEKHRLVFRLDRKVSITEYEPLYKYLKNTFFPSADNTFDAGRFFYGSGKAEYVHVLDSKAALPVDNFLNIAPVQTDTPKEKVKKVSAKNRNSFPKSPVNTVTKPENTTPVLDYISRDADENSSNISEILNDWLITSVIPSACSGEVTEFFNRYYDFNFKERNTDKKSGDRDIIKYEGNNPFSDTNTTGSSFTFSVLENGYIVWSDRKNADESTVITNNNQEKHGGTLLDFVYLYSKQYLGLFQHGTASENLIAVAIKISNDFGVEMPELNCGINWLYRQVCRDFKGKLYRAGWMSSKKEHFYLLFDTGFKRWRFFISNKLTAVINHINDNYSVVKMWIISKALRDLADEKITKAQYKAIVEKDLASQIINKLNSNYAGSSDVEMEEYPLEDYDYLPFQNGIFNHKTQELEVNIGQGFNRKVLPFDYENVTDDHPVIVAYNYYIDSIFDNPIFNKLARAWHIMAVTNQAGKSGMCFGIGGKTFTFKTSYHSLITNMFANMAVNFDVDDVFNNNAHSSSQLEGLRAFNIQELNDAADTASLKKILSKFGNTNVKHIPINPKNEAMRLIPNNFAFTFDYEGDTITLPNTGKTGYFRRMITVRTTDNLSEDVGNTLKEMFDNGGILGSENARYLLCWLIKQNGKAALSEFRKLSESKEVIENQSESLAESNDTYRFMRESMVFTDDDSEMFTKDLYKWFECWCAENGIKYPMSNRRFFASLKNLMSNKRFGVRKTLETKIYNGQKIYIGLSINDEMKATLQKRFDRLSFCE